MAENLLDRPEIGPTFQEMGGHGMPEAVRAQIGGTRHCGQGPVHDAPRYPRVQPPAALAEEHRPARSGHDQQRTHHQPARQRLACRTAQRRDSFFAALAEDSHQSAVEIHIVQVEATGLRHPDAGRIEHFHHSQVPARQRSLNRLRHVGGGGSDGVQHRSELADLDRGRKSAIHSRGPQRGCGVTSQTVGVMGPGEEGSHRGRPPGDGASLRPDRVLIGEPRAQIGQLNLVDILGSDPTQVTE